MEGGLVVHHKGDPAAENWVRDKPPRPQGKAGHVAAGNPATRHPPRPRPAERTGADTLRDLPDNKASYLDYATALDAGWPIATGIIEGACRHLIKDRTAPRGALLYPRFSREKLGGRFLGLMAYLSVKT